MWFRSRIERVQALLSRSKKTASDSLSPSEAKPGPKSEQVTLKPSVRALEDSGVPSGQTKGFEDILQV